MKVASLLASGEKPSGAAEYLGDAQRLCSVRCPAESAADFLRPEVQLEALSARAARMVVANGMRIQGAKNFEKGEDTAVRIGSLFKIIYPTSLLSKSSLRCRQRYGNSTSLGSSLLLTKILVQLYWPVSTRFLLR
jgi:hypothetical protein